MSVFHGSVYSKCMNMRTGLTIAFPNELRDSDMPYKVIYMLHGKTDDHYCWTDQTMLPIFVNEYPVICVMPEVQKSWYEDMVYGLPYHTYITQELPELCRKLLPISTRREDTAIAGLSMGGYGAMKFALRHPEQYAMCGSFSSSCNIRRKLVDPQDQDYKELQAILGPSFETVEQADLYPLAEKCACASVKPRIYMTCGTEDALYGDWKRFGDHLEKLHYDVEREAWSGVHDWYFWNKAIKNFMDRFCK